MKYAMRVSKALSEDPPALLGALTHGVEERGYRVVGTPVVTHGTDVLTGEEGWFAEVECE